MRVVACSDLHLGVDARARQKVRLGCKAGERKSALPGGLRQQSEIHPCRDVLQSDPLKGIVVRAMTEMTQQRAVVPFRQVILRARQTVVEPQRSAAAQRTCDRLRPRNQARAVLRYIAVVPVTAGSR